MKQILCLLLLSLIPVAAQNPEPANVNDITTATISDIRVVKAPEPFEVKELQPAELAAINHARDKYNEAKANLSSTESWIKHNYGQSYPGTYTFTSCLEEQTMVELRGKYALVTHSVVNMCATTGGQ